MTVAVEESLQEVIRVLRKAGHKVVPLYGHQTPVDAIVYKDESLMRIMPSLQNRAESNSGIFMVCAGHMTPNEILQSLETRSYGSIF